MDVYAAVIGQLGKVVTFVQDMSSTFHSILSRDLLAFGKGLVRTTLDLAVPCYGYYGGAGWGVRQFGADGAPPPLNQQDWANFIHDQEFLHFNWVRNSWSFSTPGLPAGPIGQIYKVLGTGPFAAAGALQ